MRAKLKQYLLVIAAALSLILMPAAANAQYIQLSCNTSNGGVAGGTFYNQSLANGACQDSVGPVITHVFSQIVCDFVVVLNSVLGQVYCGIQYQLKPILAIVLSLYITVFGGQILMGTAQLNAKEMVVRLLKIAGVWTFATQATWGLGLIFQFFFGATAEMSMWVLQSINPALTVPNQAANSGDFGNFMPMYRFIDSLIYQAILGPFTVANNTVIGFFIILLFFFPGLFMLAANWLWKTILMLTHTLMNFLMSLAVIAFLIALSPIFLSCMLFRATAHLFEDWLKFMIAYTLQVVLVFAIIALWIATMTLFGGFFNELSAMIIPTQNVKVNTVFSPDDTYSICEYGPLMYSPPGAPGMPCAVGMPCLPALICDGTGRTFSPSQLEFREDFIYFMAYNLTVLSIIAHAFGVLVEHAPTIAKQLSGPAQAPSLPGGFGMKGFGQLTSMGRAVGKGGGKNKAPPASGKPSGDMISRIKDMLTGR